MSITGTMHYQYEIDITYKCNLTCPDCNRLVGPLPIPDCDVGLEDIQIAGKLLRKHGIVPRRIKISGGEPLLHPRFKEVCEATMQWWGPSKINRVIPNRYIKVFTNGILPRIHLSQPPFRYIRSPLEKKRHRPFAISPHDLGMESKAGFLKACNPMTHCGRLFDAFGFSFCAFAGVLGRVVGIDPYEHLPVVMGRPSICRHCIYSLSRKDRIAVEKKVLAGKISYPTKTFAEGLARNQEEPMRLKKFQERL